MPSQLLRRSRTCVAATAAALLMSGCDKVAPAHGAPSSGSRIDGIAVRVEAPRRDTFSRQVHAVGSLAARHEDQVATELGGAPIAEVLVEPGQRVRKGQVLARLGDELLQGELAIRKARREEALAAREHARLVLDRSHVLQASGAIADEELERHRMELLTASARLAATEAELRDTQLRLARTVVVAPHDGVVLTSQAVLGQITQPGTTLFTLMRQGRLEWRAEVPALHLGLVQPGRPAQLALADGGSATGEVWRIAPVVQGASRPGIVHVQLPSQQGLRPGQFARGVIHAGTAEGLTVPLNAVVSRGDEQSVFVADPSSTSVQRKVIATGQVLDDRIEVRSGLDATDRVVTVGAGYLSDGARITIVGAAPTSAGKGDGR